MFLSDIFEYASDELSWRFEYHHQLNPKLWQDERLKPEVRRNLLKIAAHFVDYLDLPFEAITDIIVTGSNANYNWTSVSDIDLHVVVDLSDLLETCPDFLEDYLTTKKQLWNKMHDLSIYGHPVELYAQDANESHIASGIYSLRRNRWLIRPIPKKPHVDNTAVKTKAAEMMHLIDSHTSGKADPDDMQAVKDRIKRLRKSGLERAGEYSTENLAFKVLRNSGYLEKLWNAQGEALDRELSLSERAHVSRLVERFDPAAVYLHGGPAALEGGQFRRYMRSGGDSGGMFFIKESEVGYKYALGYAITKFRDAAIWRVRLHLTTEDIFDFSRRSHRDLAQRNLSQQEFHYWKESSRGGHLDWAVIDEDVLTEWGFRGAVLFERPKGFGGFGEDALSVVVFDPSVIEIIDLIPKQDALERWGR